MAALDQSGAERIRTRLRGLGFDVVRFARVEPAFGPGLREWLDAGYHAEMAWIERAADKRGNPDLVLSEARTIVMLGVNYGRAGALGAWSAGQGKRSGGAGAGGKEDGNGQVASTNAFPASASSPPLWANYSLYSDYHDTIKAALAEAGRVLEAEGGIGPTDHRYYVDTGPVQERGWAARAGVGFTGKNAMLISREFGNWLFLACVLTRLELPPDAPLPGKLAGGTHAGLLCGKCTRCLDACPTNAFAAPGVVDARRCVSYQTIENKGIIPRELRSGIGNRIYGCDTCLDVCPWNRFAQASREILVKGRPEIGALSLGEILELTPARFAEVFRGTAIKRVKIAGLLRNACIVAGNTGAMECLSAVRRLADPSGPTPAAPMVRAHAVWALARLGDDEALLRFHAMETDPLVLAEYVAEKIGSSGLAGS